jgi:phage terminase large subunit
VNAVVRVEELIDWTKPDYNAILQARLERLARLRANPSRWPALRAYYREHIADWISDWGMATSPKNVADGLPADVPLVLFPKQRQWVEFTYKNWREHRYGGSPKSREVGLSWCAVAFSIALCTLYPSVAVGLGSYKEEKVDKRGEMGSLFEKARYYLRHLPIELRGGYDPDTCSTERTLIFPMTSGSIIGEIGDQIGRGSRYSIYFVDEAAYLEHDSIVDAALSKSTRCRQDISSVRGMRNSFAQRMHDGYSRTFPFHWRDNPLFTQADYDEFRKQWGSVITAQELDIDYQASVEGVIVRQEWVQAAIGAHEKLKIKPSGIKRGALDVADLGRDLNAFAARHGILVIYCSPWSGRESNIGATVEECFALCDKLQLEGFDYDADGGMGSGVRAFADRINTRRAEQRIPKKTVGPFRASGEVFMPDQKIPGTDRTPRDMFQNLKSQTWYMLAQRFEETFRAVSAEKYDADKIISLSAGLPDLSKLCIEISQPQWKYSATGKLMVDKVPDGMASPNMADALMMLFAPRTRPMKISDSAFDIFDEPAGLM